MSNYSPIIAYGPKDSLTHGDPNKAIKGVQLDAELSAVATAITSKNDTANLPGALGTGVTQYLTATNTQIRGYGPVAAGLVDFTPDNGIFTAQYSGFVGTVTGAASWTRVGKLVMLYLAAMSGTSNATNFYMTNLPAQISSSLTPVIEMPSEAFNDNGINQCTPTNFSIVAQQSGGGIIFIRAGSSANWTTSGVKGLAAPILIVYSL